MPRCHRSYEDMSEKCAAYEILIIFGFKSNTTMSAFMQFSKMMMSCMSVYSLCVYLWALSLHLLMVCAGSNSLWADLTGFWRLYRTWVMMSDSMPIRDRLTHTWVSYGISR